MGGSSNTNLLWPADMVQVIDTALVCIHNYIVPLFDVNHSETSMTNASVKGGGQTCKVRGNHVCVEGALFGVYVCVFDGRDY